MSPVSVVPRSVPRATVRRLAVAADQGPVPVQHLTVPAVPAPSVVPRQIDRVGLRLMALQLENEHLRAELEDARTA